MSNNYLYWKTISATVNKKTLTTWGIDGVTQLSILPLAQLVLLGARSRLGRLDLRTSNTGNRRRMQEVSDIDPQLRTVGNRQQVIISTDTTSVSLLRGSLLGSLKDCAMHPVGFFIGFPSIHDIKVTNLLGKKNLRVVLIVRISQLFIYLLAYMVTCLQSTLAPLHCLSIWLGRFRVGFCYTALKLQSSVSQKSLRIWNVIAIYRCELFQQPSEEIKLSSLCSTYRMGSFISILKYWDKLQSCFRF